VFHGMLFSMKDYEQYKTALEAEKKTLEGELGNIGIKNPEGGDWEVAPAAPEAGETADENDMADRFEGFEERSATLATLKKRFEDVSSALKKISDGTYGTCEVSGEPIEEDRLKANPAARTCKAHMEA
jgi:RNA polymerase-binding transcription factor DksA